MIGPFLVVIGLLLIWVAVRGKSDQLLTALNLQSVSDNINKNVSESLTQWLWNPLGQAIGSLNPFGSSSNSNSSSVSSSQTSNSPSGTDSGTHMGIDVNGNLIVINKTYANMTDAEKTAANVFAKLHPSGV